MGTALLQQVAVHTASFIASRIANLVLGMREGRSFGRTSSGNLSKPSLNHAIHCHPMFFSMFLGMCSMVFHQFSSYLWPHFGPPKILTHLAAQLRSTRSSPGIPHCAAQATPRRRTAGPPHLGLPRRDRMRLGLQLRSHPPQQK